MKRQAYNPYLPFWETVPDGEPHVFGDRVYVYGSHDRRGGTTYCMEDYVCWSAPVEDLSDWRCEGVIYRKDQDPYNGAPYEKPLPRPEVTLGTREEPRYLYAPDVAQGPDGRYYLFYALDFVNVISVAVSDSPAGPFVFVDFVTREDGAIPTEGQWFDPAILCEESGNYLYYGFAPAIKMYGMEDVKLPGGMMVKLADDMHTIVSEPVCVAKGVDTAKGTDYEAHPFFEASSIRKIGVHYYFVYSSLQGNELCYGMADTPEGPFAYKGVLVSNGDIGYQGNTLPTNYTGNNHGGLVAIGDKTYIFWHRQTHGTMFSRQGCADEVHILPDGTIPQIEITSCGLNQGPLAAKGSYPSYIACRLTERDRSSMGTVVMAGPGEALPPIPEEWPYITEEADKSGEQGLKPYIHNMREGAVAGFKYFAFDGDEHEIVLELRGCGTVEVLADAAEEAGKAVAEVTVSAAVAACADTDITGAAKAMAAWQKSASILQPLRGIHALYFRVKEGTLDFAGFEIG